jgi:hypothetical protein
MRSHIGGDRRRPWSGFLEVLRSSDLLLELDQDCYFWVGCAKAALEVATR